MPSPFPGMNPWLENERLWHTFHDERPRAGIWPIRLRDPLPIVPVPLRPGETTVPLDLKRILDQAYDECRFGNYIYRYPPTPPPHPDDAAWAEQLLRAGRPPSQ